MPGAARRYDPGRMVGSFLPDLFGHQEWADSVHWRAIGSHAAAVEDDPLRRRLYHIQAVQRAFLSVWRGSPKWPEPLDNYPSFETLRDAAHGAHRDIRSFLEKLAPARLEEDVAVPWFPAPHRPIRVLDTMHQVLLHSQGHRAQNAIRLRELGGAAPVTDYIVWILEGRPAADWE